MCGHIASKGHQLDQVSERVEGQNGPSANHNLECGMNSITSAPHRPQQNENKTNSGGSIEKCDAIGLKN